MKKFREFLEEAASDAKTPLQKHVHKQWTSKQHFAGVLKGDSPGAGRGSAPVRVTIKHKVEHHADGSSTVTFHHNEHVPHGHFDNQSHAVARCIDMFREHHGHLHNSPVKEVLNSKTKTEKDGYQAHKKAYHMHIHTKTKDRVTTMHVKPMAED